MIASVVALGVMLVRLPLKKAPKLFSYLLWGLVLFKLVCPLTVESVKALIPVTAEPIPQTIVTAEIPQIDSGIEAVDSAVNAAISSQAATPAASANPMQIILTVSAWVWAAGAVAFFTYAFVSYFLMKRRMRVAVKTGDAYESDRITTAFVLGFFTPKIYMPAGLSPKEREYILLHEQTHIKHLDYIVKPIAYAAACLHWFNPLVWLSFKLAMQDMELTCDETVLRHYNTDIRADYSRSLLMLSQKRSGLLSPLAFSETGVKPRIKNALNYKKPAFWIIIASVVLITAAAVIFLPNAVNPPLTSESSRPDPPSAVSYTPIHSSPIPAEEEIYQLSMPDPDETYLSTLAYNGTASSDWIESGQEFLTFSDDLKSHFTLPSNLTNALSEYGDSFFESKRVIAMILAEDSDLDCTFGGIRDFSSGIALWGSSDFVISDSYLYSYFRSADQASSVVIDINWKATDRTQTDENAWWLVLISVDDEYSDKLSTCDQIGGRSSGGGRERGDVEITSETKTVSYYEDGGLVTDTYIIKNGGSLCNEDGQFMINGDDFLLLPHVIGVLNGGNWHLYKKTALVPAILVPVSDASYNEIFCRQYPDGSYDPNYILARRGSLWALLDGQGSSLTDAVYGKIYLNTNREDWPVIVVAQNGKYGAIGYDGKVIVPTEYTYLTMNIQTGKIYVLKGDKWGTITLDGNLSASAVDWKTPIPTEITDYYSFYAPNGYSMTDSETQISELFTKDPGFQILGNADGTISDQQMAVYALMHMENYSYETGNTREDYDALTIKYFDKKLTDYTGGGMFEFIPNTDRIRAVGWSYDSSMYALLRSVSQTYGIYTAQFYCINISDSYWDDSPYDFAAVKQMLYNGEWEPLVQDGLTFELREVKFMLNQNEDGSSYPLYKSVEILQTGLTAPISSQ